MPQAAGSATDNIARIVAPALAKELGQAVVVDNRPGGALTIGIDAVAKAAPDGYTIGQGPVGALAITRHMVAKLPYDIERDLQPVALVTTGYMLLAVSPKAAFTSVKELIDYAKKNPGKLSNASSSNGSPGHVSGELFKYMTGTDIVHIPYKGGAPAIADLISGQVQLMFESTNSIAPHVRAGRVRALAVTGERRAHQPARGADADRGRRAGLRSERLERHHHHRRRAAPGARQAERRGEPRHRSARTRRSAWRSSAARAAAARRRNSPR